jgi:hypothetical protein
LQKRIIEKLIKNNWQTCEIQNIQTGDVFRPKSACKMDYNIVSNTMFIATENATSLDGVCWGVTAREY